MIEIDRNSALVYSFMKMTERSKKRVFSIDKNEHEIKPWELKIAVKTPVKRRDYFQG